MTECLVVDGGTLAYDVTGTGPLVVLAHGMGDSRAAYRFVAPRLVAAGYRVAALDLRGCGESTATWPTYSRTAVAGDLLALVRHLGGGPAVLVGHSLSGGAVTIAAAQAPELVAGIVELAPFTRRQSVRLGDLRVARYRTGMTRLMMTGLLGSVAWWHKYLDVAYPGRRPADWDAQLAWIAANLREPGRMRAMRRMGQSAPVDAGAQLAHITCPALVVEGSLDPDWADPRAEGEAVVAAMPAGLGRVEVIEGAGHYPHTQFPDETAALVLSFARAHARA
ncbi:alpha/beta hydrolase [Cellulomonas sp. A375-1]|uniref:alpha/beta fold hydrolase n=1 Tax=Cellulomonas sp. A375-1 TaxID=1672219 RepID=UPI00065278C4|nr:alpha/beta hydrolase [Cellulomonas sp. A375-1]KMM47386.1 alpha/beta hydrolase [Cellulomonas sp. A375-1]